MTQPVVATRVLPWSPNFLRITFAGALISVGDGQSGYEDGSFFKITFSQPLYKLKVGPDGAATRNFTNDRSFKAALRLQQGIQTNDVLSGILTADILSAVTGGGAGVGQLVVADLFGSTVFEASISYLTKFPDLDFQSEAQPREWEWEGLWDTVNVGSNVPILPIA